MSRRLAIALVAFALFFLLGHAVGRDPDPDWLMALEVPLVNHSTLIAWWLTWFGYAYILIPICAGLIALAIVRPRWRVRAPFAIVSLLLSWQSADFFQKLLHAAAQARLGRQTRDGVFLSKLACSDCGGFLRAARRLCVAKRVAAPAPRRQRS